MNLRLLSCLGIALAAGNVCADPPVASYVFPAGGQRGKTVAVRVGGLFLHDECPFAVVGPGIKASPSLKRIETLWFEGPLLPIPQSQQAEDYPRDLAGQMTIAANAPLGVRLCRVWSSQGAAPSLKFVVGDLPEIVENEVDGDIGPVLVRPPVTINGRIFPRENVDNWTVQAKKGDTYTCIVNAARLGSPLDARLEVYDAANRLLAESDDAHVDPSLRFTAPKDGAYQVRIRDAAWRGGQAFVYRLTIATGPVVDRVFPLGGRRGGSLKLDLVGHALSASTAEVKLPTDADRCRADVPGKSINPIRLDVDDVPEAIEGGDVVQSPLATPIMLNGRIGAPGEVDTWPIAVKKGELLTIETRAARFGSPLDAVVVIRDSGEKEVARVQGDKAAEWTPAADGTYRVLVRDRFRSRGGPAFAYRVKIAPAVPGFRLTMPVDAASLFRKGQAKIKINVERLGGFKEPIAITAENLPDGVTAMPLAVAANQVSADLTLKADEKAPVTAREIRIFGTPVPPKDKGKKDAPVEAPLPAQVATMPVGQFEPPLETMLLGVGLPTPFVIKGEFEMGFAARGGTHRRSYKIVRNGYDGPIEIRLAEKQARHLQGVTGPTIVVPAGKSEFVYEAYLPPWMEMGRTCRVCVMGTGTVQEEGREHRVVFSSTNQNEQLVAVVGPGQLALDLGRSAAAGRPGDSIDVPVIVKRGLGWVGPVRVELVIPRHLVGLEAEPITIAAGQDRGTIRLRVTSAARSAEMSPTVRAVLEKDGQRIVAEARLEVTLDR